jgi:hypothetical protein
MVTVEGILELVLHCPHVWTAAYCTLLFYKVQNIRPVDVGLSF